MTANRAVDISDFYQLMAAAFRYPTRELAEGLSSGAFSADAGDCLTGLGLSKAEADEICGRVTRAAADGPSEELYERMRIEYTGLFLIPKREKVFVYESRFCYPKEADPKDYSMFVSPCALHAEQVYKEAGVRVRKEKHEPPDHMATELEFMAFLFRKTAEILAENRAGEDGKRRAKEVLVWKKRREDFEKQHLNRWYLPFLCRVEEETKLEIYRSLAVLGKEVSHVSGSGR